MSEEVDNGVGLLVMVDEQRGDDGRAMEVQGQRGPVIDQQL